MMSTARLSRARTPDTVRAAMALALLLLAAALPLMAHAKESDRSQTIHVDADYFNGQAKPNSVTHLKGHVIITQGSFKATGAIGIVYLDANSRVARVVLTGSPAHIHQVDDNGNLVKGHAGKINYNVPKAVATLTGDAYINQVGRGTARGQMLIYNTTTSVMTARSGDASRVHLTFQPRQSTSESTGTQPAPATSSGGH